MKQTNQFDHNIEKGIKWALSRIKMNFEHAPNYNYYLAYHDSHHTYFVIATVEKILRTIQKVNPSFVSDRDVQIGRFAAAFHDIFIKWQKASVKEGKFTKILRKRLLPDSIGNEKASAEIALKYMDIVNEVHMQEVFTEYDKKLVQEAIEITIPAFDASTGTVIQPRLSYKTSIVARAVALADIGSAGMDRVAYKEGGDRLFVEENIDIFEAVQLCLDELPTDLKEYYRQRMINWQAFQIAFAEGRKKRIEIELTGLPDNVIHHVSALYTDFDKSITEAKRMLKKREQMSFNELLAAMGYVEA